jgi:hypothetical protein
VSSRCVSSTWHFFRAATCPSDPSLTLLPCQRVTLAARHRPGERARKGADPRVVTAVTCRRACLRAVTRAVLRPSTAPNLSRKGPVGILTGRVLREIRTRVPVTFSGKWRGSRSAIWRARTSPAKRWPVEDRFQAGVTSCIDEADSMRAASDSTARTAPPTAEVQRCVWSSAKIARWKTSIQAKSRRMNEPRWQFKYR